MGKLSSTSKCQIRRGGADEVGAAACLSVDSASSCGFVPRCESVHCPAAPLLKCADELTPSRHIRTCYLKCSPIKHSPSLRLFIPLHIVEEQPGRRLSGIEPPAHPVWIQITNLPKCWHEFHLRYRHVAGDTCGIKGFMITVLVASSKNTTQTFETFIQHLQSPLNVFCFIILIKKKH